MEYVAAIIAIGLISLVLILSFPTIAWFVLAIQIILQAACLIGTAADW